MKYLTFLFLFCFKLLSAQNIDEEGQTFINSFTQAVREHDSKAVFKHLDRKYRREQLRFLKRNKEQFINELLAGQNEVGNFMTPDFEKIINCTLLDIKELKGDIPTFEVGFEVDIPDYMLYSTLIMVKKKKKYVLIGAVG